MPGLSRYRGKPDINNFFCFLSVRSLTLLTFILQIRKQSVRPWIACCASV